MGLSGERRQRCPHAKAYHEQLRGGRVRGMGSVGYVQTVVSATQMKAALQQVFPTWGDRALACLGAMWHLETGGGAGEFNYNPSGITGSYKGMSVTPPHMSLTFRAYPSILDGVVDWIRRPGQLGVPRSAASRRERRHRCVRQSRMRRLGELQILRRYDRELRRRAQGSLYDVASHYPGWARLAGGGRRVACFTRGRARGCCRRRCGDLVPLETQAVGW